MVLKFISTPLYYVFCNARAREEAALARDSSTYNSSTKSSHVLSKILNFKRNAPTTSPASDAESATTMTTNDSASDTNDPETKRKNELAERAKKLVEERMLNSSSA